MNGADLQTVDGTQNTSTGGNRGSVRGITSDAFHYGPDPDFMGYESEYIDLEDEVKIIEDDVEYDEDVLMKKHNEDGADQSILTLIQM